MKLKQLEAIKSQHSRYVQRTQISAPTMHEHIAKALVNHEPVTLKPAKEIIRLCREKIATSNSYGSERSLSFADMFGACPAFTAEMGQYKARKAQLKGALKTYLKKAEPMLRKAELNDDADPEEIANALSDAARDAGLI